MKEEKTKRKEEKREESNDFGGGVGPTPKLRKFPLPAGGWNSRDRENKPRSVRAV